MNTEFPDPKTNTRQATGDDRRHSDADSIRREFGLTRYDREIFDYAELVPNCLEHTWNAERHQTAGGTDLLATGPPGSGKSTLALGLAQHLMDINDEIVVWRGSTARSEWVPFAPWARVCLPKGVRVSARIQPHDPREEPVDVELGDLVREVVRYSDPQELNEELLEPGRFHVVYPDPQMRGLQEIYEACPEKRYDGLEFTPEDPLNHWWFGWILARIEHGPHHWMTWIADEIGDIAPEAARNDRYGHYQKVELLKDCIVDARKTGLSVFMFGHAESDIHSMIRKKIRWRFSMNGTANPTRAGDVVGFRSIPMECDHTSQLSIGEGLLFSERAFELINWSDIPKPISGSLEVCLTDHRQPAADRNRGVPADD